MNFDKIVEGFSENSRKVFLSAKEKVSKLDSMDSVNKKTQKEVALACLMFIEETPLDEDKIVRTSFVLANSFIWHNYDDVLKRAIEIFGVLEMPFSFDLGEGFNLWEKAKEYLIMFLDEEEIVETSFVEIEE